MIGVSASLSWLACRSFWHSTTKATQHQESSEGLHSLFIRIVKTQQSTMVSRNMLYSMRESRFVVDSFVDGDSEYQHDDEAEGEEKSVDSNGVTKAAAKETKKVRMWRYLVVFMLLAAGASTSALTYLLLNGEEEEDFDTSVSVHFQHCTRCGLPFFVNSHWKFCSMLCSRIPSEIPLALTSTIFMWSLTVWPRPSRELPILREQPFHSLRYPCLKFRESTVEKRRGLKP